MVFGNKELWRFGVPLVLKNSSNFSSFFKILSAERSEACYNHFLHFLCIQLLIAECKYQNFEYTVLFPIDYRCATFILFVLQVLWFNAGEIFVEKQHSFLGYMMGATCARVCVCVLGCVRVFVGACMCVCARMWACLSFFFFNCLERIILIYIWEKK